LILINSFLDNISSPYVCKSNLLIGSTTDSLTPRIPTSPANGTITYRRRMLEFWMSVRPHRGLLCFYWLKSLRQWVFLPKTGATMFTKSEPSKKPCELHKAIEKRVCVTRFTVTSRLLQVLLLSCAASLAYIPFLEHLRANAVI